MIVGTEALPPLLPPGPSVETPGPDTVGREFPPPLPPGPPDAFSGTVTVTTVGEEPLPPLPLPAPLPVPVITIVFGCEVVADPFSVHGVVPWPCDPPELPADSFGAVTVIVWGAL